MHYIGNEWKKGNSLSDEHIISHITGSGMFSTGNACQTKAKFIYL